MQQQRRAFAPNAQSKPVGEVLAGRDVAIEDDERAIERVPADMPTGARRPTSTTSNSPNGSPKRSNPRRLLESMAMRAADVVRFRSTRKWNG